MNKWQTMLQAAGISYDQLSDKGKRKIKKINDQVLAIQRTSKQEDSPKKEKSLNSLKIGLEDMYDELSVIIAEQMPDHVENTEKPKKVEKTKEELDREADEKRIADEKAAEEKRIADEKAAEEKRIADEAEAVKNKENAIREYASQNKGVIHYSKLCEILEQRITEPYLKVGDLTLHRIYMSYDYRVK